MHNSGNKSEMHKKKSRYHRRRPKNLLDEYTRRQRKHVWLETHIWHAKRMKMIDAWGYRLADHPNDKGFRATYRAVKNNCLLQDLSYYGCIEVSGVQSQIINAMSHLTSQEAGLTIAAKCYLKGIREGHTMLYEFDQFPQGAISPVSFLWRQVTRTETVTATENVQHTENNELHQCIADNENITEDQSSETNNRTHKKEDNSQLWVWCHPASFSSVFDAITEACKSVGKTSVEKDSSFSVAADKDGTSVQGTQSSHLVNGIDHSELRVISRRYDLLRLCLTGPESHALLTDTLKLSTISSHKHCKSKNGENLLTGAAFLNDKSVNNSSSGWWRKESDSASDYPAQNGLWDKLKKASSSSVLPPGCVIGLTVHDPRLYLPKKKTSLMNATEENYSEDSDLCDETTLTSTTSMSKGKEAMSRQPSFEHAIANWPTDVAGSHIWEESVRRKVKESKMPEQELNRKRSELLVPGSQLDLDPDEISHIPLLLIQQPGSPGTSGDTGVGAGYGSGWDIILPGGWAMAFWMAFVCRGARTGGLRESQTLALEQGVPFFPNDYPDTPAGEEFNKKLKEDGETQYSRYPPAKRPNYEKLGTRSPFCPPWKELVENWSSREAGSSIAAVEPSDSVKGNVKSSTVEDESSPMDVSHIEPLYVLRSRSKLSALRNFVLRSKKVQRKGSKHPIATRTAPLPMDDLSAIVKDDVSSLVFVLVRMVGRNVPIPNSTLSIPSEEDITRLTKRKDMAGPVEPMHKGARSQTAGKSLRNLCTREIVGFVSSGHFSLSRGCGFGVGCCVLPGLVKLLSPISEKGEIVALVRGPSTQQYRFAYLTIL